MEAVAVLVLGLLAWIFLLPLGLWINAATSGKRIRALEDEHGAVAILQEDVRVLRERLARLEQGAVGVAPGTRPAEPAAEAVVPAIPRVAPGFSTAEAPPAPVSPAIEKGAPLPVAPEVRPAGPRVASEPVSPVPPQPVAPAEPAPPRFESARPEAPSIEAKPLGVPLDVLPAAPIPGAAMAPEPPPLPVAVEMPAGVETPAIGEPAAAATPDWESVVGASWLSKVGVLVLVVGLALFLGYSLANMGPVGRLTVGAVVSLAIFASGRSLERRERYAILGHALVGGGWSGLYFTTYAAHGLEASRVVENPVLAGVMLAIVAAALIGDSLRYRVEAVTGLAFASGFATLLIAPGDGFAHIAIVGFAGALLAVARRLGWRGLAIFGAIAAYGTLLVRPDAVPWTGEALTVLTVGKGSLVLLWLLFEAYSITGVGASDEPEARTAEAAVWLTNLGGFLLVTFVHVYGSTSQQRITFFLTCAAAYVASAALRGLREPRGRDATPAGDAEASWARGITQAGGSFAAALGLITLAILQLPEGQLELALLVEAQVVFVAGLAMRPLLLRSAAGVLFAMVVALLADDYLQAKVLVRPGPGWHTWPHLATIAAALLYANSAIARRRGGLLGLEPAYLFVGTALVVALIEHGVRDALLGPAWLLAAIVLAVIGLAYERVELRVHAYGVALLAAGATAVHNGLMAGTQPWTLTWLPLGLCAAVFWGLGLSLARPAREGEADHPEDVQYAAHGAIWIGCGLAVLLADRAWPNVLPAARLGAIGVALFESGRLTRSSLMRGVAHLFVYLGLLGHVSQLASARELFGIPERLWSAAGLAGVALAVRWRAVAAATDFERMSDRGLAWAPAGLLTAAVPAELDGWPVASVWAGLALAYGAAGRRTGGSAERWRSYLLGGLAFGTAMLFALAGEGTDELALRHGLAVIGVLTALAWLAPGGDDEREGERAARPVLACLATVLGGTLLATVLEPRWLTLGWGALGTASLGLGFVLRVRSVRLAGLGWLGLCTAKLFLYDLSGLETPYRILSFIVMGLLMIAVSWAYARLEARRARA